jgi:hypothetical protein
VVGAGFGGESLGFFRGCEVDVAGGGEGEEEKREEAPVVGRRRRRRSATASRRGVGTSGGGSMARLGIGGRDWGFGVWEGKTSRREVKKGGRVWFSQFAKAIKFSKVCISVFKYKIICFRFMKQMYLYIF